MYNDKFFAEWQPIHNKGLLVYILRIIVPLLIAIVVSDFIFFLFMKPLKSETVSSMVFYCISMILCYIVINTVKWVYSEQRYKEIAELLEEVLRERTQKKM